MSRAHVCPRCRTPWPVDYANCPTCDVIAHVRNVEPLSADEAKSLIAHRKFNDFYEARQAKRDKPLIDTLEAAYAAEDAPDGP